MLAEHAAAMQKAVRVGALSGIAATVIHKGQVVYQRGFGFADLENKVPFRHDTICRVYCMTKAYMNFTAMMLVDEGVLSVEDPVSKYLPSMRRLRVEPADGKSYTLANGDLRVWHLLTHTAGFSYGIDFNYPPDDLQKRYASVVEGVERGRLRSLAAFVDALAKIPLCFQPGERYEYGYSTDVLGRVMEVATGKKLDSLLKERLFEPLGMTDTSFSVPEHKQGQLSAIYGNAKTWGHLHARCELAVPITSKPGLVRLESLEAAESAWAEGQVDVFSGGGLLGHNRGGLVSTVKDTEAFLRMLLARGRTPSGEPLLRQATLARMEKNQLVGPWKAAPGTRWCLLGDMKKDSQSLYIQQGGAAGNYWTLDRKRDLAIACFMQQVDGDDWEDTSVDPSKADLDEVMKEVVDKASKTAARTKAVKGLRAQRRR